MIYISLDPKPVEARIKELEKSLKLTKGYLNGCQTMNDSVRLKMMVRLKESHIADLKKIIGQ